MEKMPGRTLGWVLVSALAAWSLGCSRLSQTSEPTLLGRNAQDFQDLVESIERDVEAGNLPSNFTLTAATNAAALTPSIAPVDRYRRRVQKLCPDCTVMVNLDRNLILWDVGGRGGHYGIAYLHAVVSNAEKRVRDTGEVTAPIREATGMPTFAGLVAADLAVPDLEADGCVLSYDKILGNWSSFEQSCPESTSAVKAGFEDFLYELRSYFEEK